MKPIGIVTDSSSGIGGAEAEELGIYVLPLPFYIEDECFYEGGPMSYEEFYSKLRSGANVTTSQPAIPDMEALWDEALAKYEKILHIPISSGLSSSYSTAAMVSKTERYEGRVLVVNDGQASTPLHQMVLDTLDLIKTGRYSAQEIKDMLETAKEQMVIYVAFETLDNLKRGGRISPAAAAFGSAFNIKPVLKMETGVMEAFRKCHGFPRAKKALIEAAQNDINTRFADAAHDGALNYMIATSASERETEEWVAEAEAAFPGSKFRSDFLPFCLTCHTGPGALGIALSVKPEYARYGTLR